MGPQDVLSRLLIFEEKANASIRQVILVRAIAVVLAFFPSLPSFHFHNWCIHTHHTTSFDFFCNSINSQTCADSFCFSVFADPVQRGPIPAGLHQHGR